METEFSLSEAKSKFSDIINRIIYRKERILITKKGKKVAVIFSIDEFKKYEDKGLIEAKGALADLDETLDEMTSHIYEARKLEKSREVDL
ncbi:MAG TPA: type II toxin-antitoxin system Phd/YefM family antitoxin [Deltaproteobacteria bacterium]|nr:type II toxin-antitoxin system Phd/YefM family antitoxin [Deltaproteobacteria bacterium]